MNKSRITHLFLAAMLIMAFFLPVSVAAQDPAATELIQLPVVATTEAGEPVYGVLITPIVTPASTAPQGESDGGTDTTNSVPTPVVIVFAVLAGVVFVAFLFNQQALFKIVAPLVPVDTSKAIAEAMLPSMMSLVMNTIAKVIPTTIDDEGFIEAAKLRGLVVTLGEDGLYHTVRAPETTAASVSKPSTPYPPATGTPMETDFTRSKTGTLPTRPSDGGASGGGTGFPPVR